MSILASLKLVELKPPAPKPVLNRRRKLIAKIDAQIQLTEAAQRASGKGNARSKRADHSAPRISPWWHETVEGKIILAVRYSGKPLELAPGKAAIECEDIAMVATTLNLIRQAVIDGELDELLAPARRLGRQAGLRKGASKRV